MPGAEQGTGGFIAIDSKLIVLDESQIPGQGRIGGHGGNINITGDVFLVNSGGTSTDLAHTELSTPPRL